MADKKLQFTIGAKDDASKVFQQVGKSAKKSMSDVDDSFDESESAGKAYARALTQVFDDLDAEIKKTAQVADTLGQALGPELASKVDTTAIVAEFRKAGLSLQDIEADADSLAAAIKRADDVSGNLGHLGGSAKNAAKDTEHLSDSARGAHSALANMVGNSAQDLGNLGGPIGSLGVGIGQMAEYAADATLAGEGLTSALGSMTKVAGPIALLSGAIAIVSTEMNRGKKAAEESKKRIKDFFDAIQDGQSVLDVFAKTLKDTGELKFTGFGDIAPALDRMNISLDQFSKLVQLPPDQLQAWLQAQRKLVTEGTQGFEDMKNIAFAAVTANDDYQKSAERAEVTQRVLGDTQAMTAAQTKAYTDSLADNEKKLNASQAAAEAHAKTEQEAADQIGRVTDKLKAQSDALNDQVDAATDAADAQRDENKALKDFAGKLNDAEASTDDVTDAAIALARAHVATAAAQAQAAGATQTATQKLDAQNGALLQTAASARGPARQAILSYIASVNGIPPEKLTEINAAIDRGDIATAEHLLNSTSRTRQSAINADANTAAANAQLDYAARTRTATIRTIVTGQGPAATFRAGGGPVSAGQTYVVGEEGPEVFVPKSSGTIIPNGGDGTPVTGGGGGVVNVTINMPPGSDPDAVVRAIKQYERRNGSGWRR